jgi:hypothetical protein
MSLFRDRERSTTDEKVGRVSLANQRREMGSSAGAGKGIVIVGGIMFGIGSLAVLGVGYFVPAQYLAAFGAAAMVIGSLKLAMGMQPATNHMPQIAVVGLLPMGVVALLMAGVKATYHMFTDKV